MELNPPITSKTDLLPQPMQFEQEPDWSVLPDEISSIDVARILHIDRKTLTKYAQTGKINRPVAKGTNWSRYRKDDVIGLWRTRQVRIAQGSIKVDKGLGFVDPYVDEWEGDYPQRIHPGQEQIHPGQEGGTGVEGALVGPVPGGGVETLPEPQGEETDLAGTGLVSLSRVEFQTLMLEVVRRAQEPLLRQLEASETRAKDLTQAQADLVTQQREFLDAQTEAQGQQAEAWRQMLAGQDTLAKHVAHLTEQLARQNVVQQEVQARRDAEPVNAWERFKRSLGLPLGQR